MKLAVFKNTDFRIDGEKTTYSLQIGRNMADETFTETDLAELRKLDASYLYTGQYGFNPVPTLREYCEFIRDLPVITNIEMKTGVLSIPAWMKKSGT